MTGREDLDLALQKTLPLLVETVQAEVAELLAASTPRGLREALEDAVAVIDSGIANSRRPDREGFLTCDRLRAILAANPVEPAPVASPERVAKVLHDHYYDVGWSKEHQGFRCVCGWLGEDHVQHVTDVLAAGVFRDEAKVKTEALQDAAEAWDQADADGSIGDFADQHYHAGLNLPSIWLHHRAGEAGR